MHFLSDTLNCLYFWSKPENIDSTQNCSSQFQVINKYWIFTTGLQHQMLHISPCSLCCLVLSPMLSWSTIAFFKLLYLIHGKLTKSCCEDRKVYDHENDKVFP